MRKAIGSKRIAARLTVVLLLVVLLFSVFFIAVEADHDCTHEDCTICACLRCCEFVLRRLIGGSSAAAFVPVLGAALIISALFPVSVRIQDTPVSAKIRLNN